MKTTYTPPAKYDSKSNTSEAIPAGFPLPRLRTDLPPVDKAIALFFSQGKFLGWTIEVTANAYRHRVSKKVKVNKDKYDSYWYVAKDRFANNCLYVQHHTVQKKELIEADEATVKINEAVAAGKDLAQAIDEFDGTGKHKEAAVAYRKMVGELWAAEKAVWEEKIKDMQEEIKKVEAQKWAAYGVIQKKAGQEVWGIKEEWDWVNAL